MVKSIYQCLVCYVNQTYTNCSPWHDLPMSSDNMCSWSTLYAWVTCVRKKWLSLWYSAYVCDIHQIFILTRSTDCMWLLVSLTYILRLSDHDIEVVKCMYILQYLGVLHLSNLHQLFILTRSNDVILWWFVSLTSILHLRSHDQEEMIRPFA